MKLASVTFEGFRRFLKKTTLKTNSKLTVLIGPNEAGKSSILRMLTLFSDNSEFVDQDRYKFSDDVEIELRATFHLEEEDYEAIGSTTPTSYVWWKEDNGKLFHKLVPRLSRPKEHREAFKKNLVRCVNHQLFVDEFSHEELDVVELQKAATALNTSKETYDESDLNFLLEIARIFAGIEFGRSPKYLGNGAKSIEEFLEIERLAHPNAVALKTIEQRRPSFVEFTDEDRTLDPSFNVSLFEHENAKQAVEPCNALQNLCEISGLDLHRLKQNLTDKKHDRIQSQIDNANMKLRKIFDESWSQSDISIYLGWQKPEIQIMVQIRGEENLEYNLIDERSDGFRQYVALLAFIIKEDAHTPILLIDEAELHLHYDAQADLIQTFTERKLASQVIYTTHSAGCLPEDLGVGVKLIEQVEDGDDFATSRIENNFWSNDTLGFSPILYGMGAQTLAFFPTRKAVVTEGQTEMLLMPTILRQVSNADFNGFQVVPGLANAAKSRMGQFASQGDQVVYLLDNDIAGKEYRKNLVKLGIQDERIFVVSGSGKSAVTVEDWVDDIVFSEAVELYRTRFFSAAPSFKSGFFDGDGKADKLKSYEKMIGCHVSKTVLAYIILEVSESASGRSIYNKRHKKMLQKLRADLIASFD
ncbi:AAA family ATPase [Maritalea sp.]|uniref:AAA family ATPase n=1 Tax=Maritalea sp. TaxID=2003361 RepID=UPI003EF67C8D